MKEYVAVLQKYVVFSGRATRREYWMFTLVNFLIALGLGVVGNIIGNTTLGSLYSLIVLLPGFAVGIRRLHDTGRSGWWNLIALIPIIGWIVLLVFLCLDSTPGENKYGPNPKNVDAVVPPTPIAPVV